MGDRRKKSTIHICFQRVVAERKESINRAFSYMLTRKGELSIAREMDESDLRVEVIDLMHNRAEGARSAWHSSWRRSRP